HLSKISGEFSRGDFSGPARIHGEDMPGLAALRAAQPGRIKIEYKDLPNGAEIVYSSDDPGLIKAIHDWFDAQLSDHARHAVPGHPHPHHPRHRTP
ncbi:MAG: aspartate carbamoyltransferase, partial [Methylosarcina sp.]